MFGLTSTRRHREELAAARAEADRLRAERDTALEDTSAAKAAAKTAACLFKEADEKYVDVCIVNELLTTDLTAARERLAEYGGRRTVAEVLEEHDVHRKALADALGEQKRHLGWGALIGEVGGLAGDLAAARRELAAVRKVEESLARQIHEMAQPVEPSDEEVDAAQLRLELDAERSRADQLQQRLDAAAREPADGEWRGRARRAEKDVERLQKRLDDAVGMPPGGLLDSAVWQPGYQAPKSTPKASAS